MTEIATIELANNQYGEIVILDEYNGAYSLVQGTAGKDRNFFKMVHPATKSGPSEKKIPMKVNLGNREEAARALRYLADVLSGSESSGMRQSAPAVSHPADSFDDDIPF